MLSLAYSKNLTMTPDFGGLPNLEHLNFSYCVALKKIHSSIGYLERLVYLNLEGCSKLKMFPPIVRMEKLETLILNWCPRLRKFPEIQHNMDSLENLHLDGSQVEVLPSSIGQYCTSLVSIDLRYCEGIKNIEDNFHLKHLRRLNLCGCKRLRRLPKHLFDVDSCLEELRLPSKSSSQQSFDIGNLKFTHLSQFLRKLRCLPSKRSSLQSFDMGNLEFTHLSRFLRKLDFNGCRLVDGDIPSDISKLSNLQEIDLQYNDFTCLHGLSQLSRLKFLNLSNCERLVELPKLPSSIAILEANNCNSLVVGDLPTNCKWLWKVSLWRKNVKGYNQLSLLYEGDKISGDRVLQSMLQGKAIENYFMSLQLPLDEIPKRFEPSLVKGDICTVQLPENWYNDFSGFLIFITAMIDSSILQGQFYIAIKQEIGRDSQCMFSKDLDEEPEFDSPSGAFMFYVPFISLRHTAWWSSRHNTISFSYERYPFGVFNGSRVAVELVCRRSKEDPTETTTATTDCSEFWDEHYANGKTFKIIHDSMSALEFLWNP